MFLSSLSLSSMPLNDNLRSIQDSLTRISSENIMVYQTLNNWIQTVYNVDPHDKDIYDVYLKFENSVFDACIKYLSNINRIHQEEHNPAHIETEDDRRHQLGSFKVAYATFNSKLKDILHKYKIDMKKIGEQSEFEECTRGYQAVLRPVSRLIYEDGYSSNSLKTELIQRYQGSYYYQENLYNLKPNGDLYIEYNHDNEDLLIKYMNNDSILKDDIKKMDNQTKLQFIKDLDFFELPVKSKYIELLSTNTEEEYRRKRVQLSNNIEENNDFSEVLMESPEPITNDINNNRSWYNELLYKKQLACEEMFNTVVQEGFNIDRHEIEQDWMSIKHIYINNKNHPSLEECFKRNNMFISLYEKNISNEQSQEDGTLYVNISLKFPDVIQNYLDNNKQWESEYLSIPKLKYNDILTDLDTVDINLNDNEKRDLKRMWKIKRSIYANNEYKRLLNLYLQKSDQFITIYEKYIENEQYDDNYNWYYISLPLKYEPIISDYITHNNTINDDLIREDNTYNFVEFMDELNLLGINLSQEEIHKLQELNTHYINIKIDNSMNSFHSISKILDKEYDCLKEWLGNEYEWECIYRASEHGYTAKSFHEYCDNKGPTLIIIKSHNGYIFGGYTTKSWSGDIVNKVDNDGFIFTLKNDHDVPPTRYNALRDKGGIQCRSDRGPIFCGNNYYDIYINNAGNNCNELFSCWIKNNGNSGYECHPQYKSSLFVNTDGPDTANYFRVEDYEVFAIKSVINYSTFLNGTKIVDHKYDQYLNEWLGNEYEWKCIYRASNYEYKTESFHERCDNATHTLIVIKSHNGYIFGGYTAQLWKGWNDQLDKDSFIFTLYNPHEVPPTRYNVLIDRGGIGRDFHSGPVFRNITGEIDINISNTENKKCNEHDSCSIFNNGNNGYECHPQYKSSLFVNTAGPDEKNYFSVKDYEVFSGTKIR